MRETGFYKPPASTIPIQREYSGYSLDGSFKAPHFHFCGHSPIPDRQVQFSRELEMASAMTFSCCWNFFDGDSILSYNLYALQKERNSNLLNNSSTGLKWIELCTQDACKKIWRVVS